MFRERCLLWPLGSDSWVVLTPDQDAYVECIGGPDPEGALFGAPAGEDRELPEGLGAAGAYRFQEWPPDQVLRRLIA